MPGSPVQSLVEPGEAYDNEGRRIGTVEQAVASMSTHGGTTLELTIALDAYTTDLRDALDQGELVITIGTVEAPKDDTDRITQLERELRRAQGRIQSLEEALARRALSLPTLDEDDDAEK